MQKLSDRFLRIDLTFGFMDKLSVTKALSICRKKGFKFEIMQTSFYLGPPVLVRSPTVGLPVWQ